MFSSSTLMLKQTDLLAGEGVEIAADGVDFAGDVLRRAGGGPLKTMCSTKCDRPDLGGGFVARTGVDPGTHRDRAHVRHGLGETPACHWAKPCGECCGWDERHSGGLFRRTGTDMKRPDAGHAGLQPSLSGGRNWRSGSLAVAVNWRASGCSCFVRDDRVRMLRAL